MYPCLLKPAAYESGSGLPLSSLSLCLLYVRADFIIYLRLWTNKFRISVLPGFFLPVLQPENSFKAKDGGWMGLVELTLFVAPSYGSLSYAAWYSVSKKRILGGFFFFFLVVSSGGGKSSPWDSILPESLCIMITPGKFPEQSLHTKGVLPQHPGVWEIESKGYKLIPALIHSVTLLQ